jgi:chromosome segregation ATPase
MTGKRSRARAHDDDEEDDQQSEASDDASAESASPGPSKRARNRGVNGHSIGDEAEEMTTNGYQQEDDDDPSLRRRPGRGRPRAKGQAEEDGWKPGAIRRVKLENFITYEHAEFFPGPSLNMVLGPNGTGKSSLVCAICLGLGYKSEVLGRASAYGEFVKHGKDKATVEIELQKRPGDRTNSVVTLRINREDNSRKFSINGKETTHKEVQALNRSMRIQIDNLCQFLPQDKVAEFAGLSPVELLSKTLQAAAPPEMAEWQDELKNLYGHQKEFQARLKEDDAQLTRLENRQQSLQGDVERIRETQRISAEIERLKTILIAVEYREAKDHFSAIRDQLKELQSQYRSLKGRYAPALEGVNAKEKYMRQIQTVVDVRQRNLKGAEDEAEAVLLKNEAVASSIQNIRIKMEGNENILNAKKKEIGDVKKKITDLQAKYKSKPADFNAAHWNTQIVRTPP